MIRVQRHDSGAWVTIPADSLRWGPNLGKSTCGAGLISRGKVGFDEVRYFLPFPGAKFAVRVTIPEKVAEERPAAVPGFSDRMERARALMTSFRPGVVLVGLEAVHEHGDRLAVHLKFEAPSVHGTQIFRDAVAEWIWSGNATLDDYDRLIKPLLPGGEPALTPPGSAARARLGALLDAAADALRSEAAEAKPDALGRALELLAECLPAVERVAELTVSAKECCDSSDLADTVRVFLENQTSGEIRRAFPGLPVQDIETLRSAVAWLLDFRLRGDASVCADRLCALTDRLVAQGRADA